MRLWSIHPKYLDSKGLVALWREGLLAKHVLEGRTKGYTRHPQLERFKGTDLIDDFLLEVWDEAKSRDYNFDKSKINPTRSDKKLDITDKQLDYEFNHLKKKLRTRDPQRLKSLPDKSEPHPLFTIIKGPIAEWEKI